MRAADNFLRLAKSAIKDIEGTRHLDAEGKLSRMDKCVRTRRNEMSELARICDCSTNG